MPIVLAANLFQTGSISVGAYFEISYILIIYFIFIFVSSISFRHCRVEIVD